MGIFGMQKYYLATLVCTVRHAPDLLMPSMQQTTMVYCDVKKG
jgi:hypothetical protein